MARDTDEKMNPWTTVPKTTAAIFFVAVFLTFSTMGFINDISDMGRLQMARFVGAVMLSGLFAVIYAWSGVRLRGRWWMVAIPLFLVQITVMRFLGQHYPDVQYRNSLTVAETASLEQRLGNDSLAVMAAIILAYTGYVFVFIGEFKRRMRVTTEKAVLETEMAAAREVQQVILPESAASFPGFRVETAYLPAQQVGGDFFQILADGDKGILVIVGDVAGKGLPAAMLVSMLVGSIRTAAEETRDPARILRIMHDRLVGRSDGGFTTAIAAQIGRDGTVKIANAGHLPPYLNGNEIELGGTLPLGFAGAGQYQATSFAMAPGSRLVFCTDGVVEAKDGDENLFGFDRTKQISTKPAAEIGQAAKDFGQSDDITVVAIERNSQ
jgi:hypothetical protein